MIFQVVKIRNHFLLITSALNRHFPMWKMPGLYLSTRQQKMHCDGKAWEGCKPPQGIDGQVAKGDAMVSRDFRLTFGQGRRHTVSSQTLISRLKPHGFSAARRSKTRGILAISCLMLFQLISLFFQCKLLYVDNLSFQRKIKDCSPTWHWFMDRPLLMVPVSTGWNATSHESQQVGSVDGWIFLAVLHRYKPNFALLQFLLILLILIHSFNDDDEVYTEFCRSSGYK